MFSFEEEVSRKGAKKTTEIVRSARPIL